LDDPEALGLLALMLLHEARRESRTTPTGELVLLEDQDRSRWDRAQIAEAETLIERALQSRRFGAYTLHAAIAAVHASAASVVETDWKQIVALYDRLLRIQPSPVVQLNRAVAIAMRDGPEVGLTLIDEVLEHGELDAYYLAHSARADMCRRLGRIDEARASYRRALELARLEPERRFLQAESTNSKAASRRTPASTRRYRVSSSASSPRTRAATGVVRIAHQLLHHRRHHLPRRTELVLQPTALLGGFVPTGRQLVPEVIELLLRLAVHLKRDRLVEFELRPAIERCKRLTIELEFHGHHRTGRATVYFLSPPSHSARSSRFSNCEYVGVEPRRFFGPIIEPQAGTDLLAARLYVRHDAFSVAFAESSRHRPRLTSRPAPTPPCSRAAIERIDTEGQSDHGGAIRAPQCARHPDAPGRERFEPHRSASTCNQRVRQATFRKVTP
jgi:tetratricopeptide (TPR) repeat protein